jgi:hypothetical protein
VYVPQVNLTVTAPDGIVPDASTAGAGTPRVFEALIAQFEPEVIAKLIVALAVPDTMETFDVYVWPLIGSA